MKLNLKHLAAYLPYNLQMIFEKSRRIITMQACFDNGSLHIIDCNEGNEYMLSKWKFKPILRSLSDLTKEINHNGETFVPIEKLKWEDTKGKFNASEPLSYLDAQSLLSWHFDIYGLINAGLAIDINTITEK